MFGGFLVLNGDTSTPGFWKWFFQINLLNVALAFVFALAAGAGLAIGWGIGS